MQSSADLGATPAASILGSSRPDSNEGSSASRGRPGVSLVSWAFPREPTAGEAESAQAEHDERTLAHRAPDEVRAIVLDHCEYGSLVDAKIVAIDPRCTSNDASLTQRNPLSSERRVERVEESVATEEVIAVATPHRRERWNRDLRSERD